MWCGGGRGCARHGRGGRFSGQGSSSPAWPSRQGTVPPISPSQCRRHSPYPSKGHCTARPSSRALGWPHFHSTSETQGHTLHTPPPSPACGRPGPAPGSQALLLPRALQPPKWAFHSPEGSSGDDSDPCAQWKLCSGSEIGTHVNTQAHAHMHAHTQDLEYDGDERPGLSQEAPSPKQEADSASGSKTEKPGD